jgi:hypothetical protein
MLSIRKVFASTTFHSDIFLNSAASPAEKSCTSLLLTIAVPMPEQSYPLFKGGQSSHLTLYMRGHTIDIQRCMGYTIPQDVEMMLVRIVIKNDNDNSRKGSAAGADFLE